MSLSKVLESELVLWPAGRDAFFIPRDCLEDNTFTPEMVQDALRELFPASEEEQRVLQDSKYICANAKKIFSILLYGFRDSEDRTRDIRKFVDERISDSDLPFTRVPREEQKPDSYKRVDYWLCRNDHEKKCQGKHNEKCSIQAMASWDRRGLDNFFTIQWMFHVPVFRKIDGDIPHQDFDQNVIMPYVEDFEREAIIGGFSKVWKVKMHPAHQDLYGPKRPAPFLAIKKPYSTNQELFKRERDMLIKIAKRRHSYLIQLLATYTLGGEYHFLFPWADTNLRKLWEKEDLPLFNKQTYLWILQQMRGLTSALQVIHEYEFPEAYAPLSEGQLTVGRFRISGIKQTDPKFGRHGDLKPENILFFEATRNLQITDLGLGQFHGVKSRSKVAAERIGGSETYIPPEILLNEPVSRAYDIWSLGCVFLEFITWLVEGGKAVQSFADNRIEKAHDKIEDDTFFIIAQGKAFVRKGVTSWIERLKGNLSGRCSPMVKDLLELVLDDMLVIDYRERIKVEPLYFKLKAIHERGKREPQYLLG